MKIELGNDTLVVIDYMLSFGVQQKYSAAQVNDALAEFVGAVRQSQIESTPGLVSGDKLPAIRRNDDDI